jgi:ankyrin repeat protein
MPINSAVAAARCYLADLPDVLLSMVLGKLSLEDVASVCSVCQYLRQLPMQSFLQDVLNASFTQAERDRLLVDMCRRQIHWPLQALQALAETVSVNKRDMSKHGWTPLIIAVDFNNQPVVEALVAVGADVNLADIYGRTPLWRCAQEGNSQIAEVLIAAGADLNASCRIDGSSPLLLAVYHRKDAVAYTLIAAGADVNAPDSPRRRTPLWYAFQNEQVKAGGADLCEALMEAGARLEADEEDEGDDDDDLAD